ncbi:uncharacterized protein MONOS_6358 [Monocercomonoides exilis]|uniref:uncharacterized protein n=1 Tax=Monocercomonoides exilis TaxID=2049356 RepID=UPI003559754E|nr:hypothetical protein MONOS_6358 [Monocercomonoides exilis]|eukprot:MONOS_6358.1-p1 / transcript=MONOS_6358.1 / gene=MONOS_6358 / organism=Monocercomonoides_exilis_PA203 / gene_product=unspecified product / transcript_product=unspecified product / location=Mono_scaffold00199:35865-40160(+) / protein_length=1399 / sequence_SO=supercontig / SO=protein_coding / is_pseudo=false
MRFLILLAFISLKSVCELPKDKIIKSVSVFPPTGSQINPRYSPFFQYFVSEKGKPSIFVYGGTTYNDVILSDAYVVTLDHVFIAPVQIPLESKKPLVKFFAQFKVNNTFFIWGGWKDTGLSNTLWSFNFSSQVWKEVDQGDSIPEARYSMAYASDDNKLYVFGGISASGLLNDLWEFDTQTKKWKVIKINSNENGPKRCSGAGMFISNGYAVVFGGDTEGDDVYDFNMFRIKIDANSIQSWEEVKITDLDGNNKNIPVSRSNFGHTTRVISSESFLYLFGGWNSNNYSSGPNSILLFNCSQVGSNGNGQKEVAFKEIIHDDQSYFFGDCGCTIDNDGNVFIFGGRMNSKICSDLIAVMKEDLSFNITEESLNSPEAVDRRDAYKKQLLDKDDDDYIFGRLRNNYSHPSFFSSFDENSIAKTSIEKESIKAKTETILRHNLLSRINGDPFISLIKAMDFAPSPRVNPIVGFSNGAFFVYGGRDPITGEILSDLHIYVIKLNQWFIQLPEITSERPPARELGSFCFDNNRILLFGGLGPNPQTGKVEPSNELWEFSFSTLSYRQLGKNSFIKPYPVFGAACAMYMDYLIVIGGKQADGQLSENGFVFNFASDEWEYSLEYAKSYKSSILVKEMLPKLKNEKNTPMHRNTKKRNNYQDTSNSFISNSKNKEHLGKNELVSNKSESEKIRTDDTRKNHTLFLFGGNQGTIPFYGIREDNIYEHFSKRKNGTNSNKGDEMRSPSDENGNFIHIDGVDEVEIFNNLDGIALSFQNTMLMFGGRKRNLVQDTFKYFKIHDNWTIDALEDDGSFSSKGMHLDIVEAGCTVFNKSVICFGGRQVSENRTVLVNALDTFRIIRLNEKFIHCSPGTYEDQNGECQLCELGEYKEEYGNGSCEKCPKGSYGTAFGSQKFGCLPVPAGIFSENEGAFKFVFDNMIYSNGLKNCTDEQYCPIGSASSNNKNPNTKSVCEQPEPFDTKEFTENILTYIFYFGSVGLGVVIALSFLCFPTKAFLYKLDSYSDKYVDQLDPDTHSTIKHIRKTTFGGFISIIAFCFVIGAALLIIVTFACFNINETRTTEDISMEKNADITKIENENIQVELTLLDYTGECIEKVSDNTHELSGECSGKLGLGKFTFDAFDWYDSENEDKSVTIERSCTQMPSSNLYYPPTKNCQITLKASKYKNNLSNSEAIFFSLFSSERNASCRAIKVKANADSAVKKQKKTENNQNNYPSTMEDIFVLDENVMFHGPNPTNITIELIPSFFLDEKKKKNSEPVKGHLINHISFNRGSLSSYSNMYFSTGFGVNILLKQEKTIIITNRSFKIAFKMFLTLLGGTFAYMGYFGNVLPVFETLMNVNWPCGRNVKKKITTVFNDSSRITKKRSANRGYAEEMKSSLDQNIVSGFT